MTAFDVHLAGDVYRVRWDGALRDGASVDRSYAPFLGAASGREARSVTIPVRILTEGPAAAVTRAHGRPIVVHDRFETDRASHPSQQPPGRLLFDNGESWRMFADGPARLLVHRQGAWTAVIQPHGPGIELMVKAGLYAAGGGAAPGPFAYPVDYWSVLLRLAAQGSGMIVHGAGLERKGRAVVCPAVSGTGKSTLSRLMRPRDGVTALSDDRIILRRSGTGVDAWGTPWLGDAGVCANRRGTLRALVFPRQAPANKLTPLERSQAALRLVPTIAVPWFDPDYRDPVLAFCDALLGDVECYDLAFRPNEGAADLLEQVLG